MDFVGCNPYCSPHHISYRGYPMPIRPRKEFDITVSEMETIEEALRGQVRQLCKIKRTQSEPNKNAEASDVEQIDARMQEIQSVLGKLHNQKNWYTPPQYVPRG